MPRYTVYVYRRRTTDDESPPLESQVEVEQPSSWLAALKVADQLGLADSEWRPKNGPVVLRVMNGAKEPTREGT